MGVLIQPRANQLLLAPGQGPRAHGHPHRLPGASGPPLARPRKPNVGREIAVMCSGEAGSRATSTDRGGLGLDENRRRCISFVGDPLIDTEALDVMDTRSVQ
jgi:hypothetical protein